MQSDRLYRRIVEQIEDALLRGELRPGQRLPSERELVAQFGASRSTIREALRVLENDGVVRSRPGDKQGPELLPFSTAALARQMTRLVRFEQITIAELISSRMIFDSAAARLAAVLHTADELAEMEAAVASMNAAMPDDLDAFGQADLAFHEAVARASRNTFVQVSDAVVHDVVLSLITDDIDQAQNQVSFMARSAEFHGRILAAIRERDGITAARLSRQLLFDFYANHVSAEQRVLLAALVDE
ncbi:FadR/GntR family transcriptional regulator [Streptomyces dysideae]|uniref:FadR/GntR family transcriptional regulator n=1 Tax=Streptomyces dysideae TaxID=909626 RepID=UPI000A8862D9|nr:FadR/GntR family transcriptional regulator [Streptomyces dysideae]